MKKNLQFSNEISVNYKEVTNDFSIYEIKIENPFLSKKISGVGYTKNILSFFDNPHNETLNKIGKDGLWFLIKKDALEDLQKKAELRKYIDIKCTNHPGKDPQYIYSYNIIDTESIKEINEENINKDNNGFILIDFDVKNKVIKDIEERVVYFEQLYYLPIEEVIDMGAEGVTHYTYNSAPRIPLTDIIKKGLKNPENFKSEEIFLNTFRQVLNKRENLQYVSESNEISRLINVKEASYQKAWELHQAFKEVWGETNESIMLTLLLFKVEGIDQKLGFNTSVFYENGIRNQPDKLLTYQSIVSSVNLEHELLKKKSTQLKSKI